MNLFTRSVLIAFAMLLLGCSEKSIPIPPAESQTRPTLSLHSGTGRVLVPVSAVIERGGVPGVYVLAPTSQARFRMIRLGKQLKDQLEVLSGLDGNEILVTGDLQTLHDGTPIIKK